MRKGFVWALILAMLLLCACGGNSGQTDQSGKPSDGQTVQDDKAQQQEQPKEGSGEESIVTELSGPVTIEFWHSISNTVHVEILDNLLQEFNDTVGKEKGITVNATYQGPEADLYNKMTAAIRSGNAPDVALAVRMYLADYLQTDYVVDLTPYVYSPTVGIEDVDDFFPKLFEGGTTYGKEGLFSLPIHPHAEVLYYNRGFFEENGLTVPTNWEEMAEVSRTITDLTGRPAFGWDNLSYCFMTLEQQLGGEYTTNDGKLPFVNDPATLEVLNMWKKYAVEEKIWRSAGEDMYFSGPFSNGTVMMYVGNTVKATYINKNNPDLNWSAAPLPQADPDHPVVETSGHVICALNMTGDKEREYAAYEFIKFMTSKEAAKALAMGSGYLPIRQSVVDDPEYQAWVTSGRNDSHIVGYEESDAFVFEPAFMSDNYTSSAVSKAVKTMMENVIMGAMDPQDALDALKGTLGQ